MNSSMFIACSPYFTYTPNTVYSVPYVLVPNLSTPNNSLTIYLNAPPTDLSLALARYILDMPSCDTPTTTSHPEDVSLSIQNQHYSSYNKRLIKYYNMPTASYCFLSV